MSTYSVMLPVALGRPFLSRPRKPSRSSTSNHAVQAGARADAMTDCLLVGFNDIDFKDYVELLRSMGTDSGAWRDLSLTFLSNQGQAMRSMDVLNHFRAKQKQAGEKLWHNADFLWPVILYLGTYLQ